MDALGTVAMRIRGIMRVLRFTDSLLHANRSLCFLNEMTLASLIGVL
jgi:hypothetical protein